MEYADVRTHQVRIVEHPNADRLELAQVADYLSAIGKGTLKDGDVVAYIPEDSVVPDKIITELNLEGKLSGKAKNRVKAVRFRGVLSQGLVYPMPGSEPGLDVAEALGIIRYEPPLPADMQGKVSPVAEARLKYKIENIKMHPGVLQEGEEVTITEKIHGTLTCLGHLEGQPLVSSKGYLAQGLFYTVAESNARNIYLDQWRNLEREVRAIWTNLPGSACYVLGETYGKGVQDMNYGKEEKVFRVFDIYTGKPGQGRFLDQKDLEEATKGLLPTVPLLYQGPYRRDLMLELTQGRSQAGAGHREGVVIGAQPEREDPEIGRVKLKSISERHLLRKGGTEYQ